MSHRVPSDFNWTLHAALVLSFFALMPLADLHSLIFGLTPFGWLCSVMLTPVADGNIIFYLCSLLQESN
jgi:hypothetical protein